MLFCTENQSMVKLAIKFGQNNAEQFEIQDLEISSRRMNIKNEKTGEPDPMFYCHHTLYLLRVPDDERHADKQIPYRIYWTDKKMLKVRSRPLREFLAIFGPQ
jgi:hypothetical protein